MAPKPQENAFDERVMQLQRARDGLRYKQVALEKKIAELQAKQAKEKRRKEKAEAALAQ